MIKKLKDIKTYGLIFTILSTLFVIALSTPFFLEDRLQPYLYNAGIDSIGSLICAALFYGCMRQEEIFVNIASYAYGDGSGNAVVQVSMREEPLSVEITFIDSGVQYDPLAKADPDTTLSAKERKKGGLGIYMVKNTMDDVIYEYKDGKNILTIKKNLN